MTTDYENIKYFHNRSSISKYYSAWRTVDKNGLTKHSRLKELRVAKDQTRCVSGDHLVADEVVAAETGSNQWCVTIPRTKYGITEITQTADVGISRVANAAGCLSRAGDVVVELTVILVVRTHSLVSQTSEYLNRLARVNKSHSYVEFPLRSKVVNRNLSCWTIVVAKVVDYPRNRVYKFYEKVYLTKK